jgi:hypothetical protein
LQFEFDRENGFVNYQDASVADCYHEAAFDAMMTGYVFGKILKYMEIDEIYQKQRHDKKMKKPKKDKDEQPQQDPSLLKDTQIDLSHQFPKSYVNKVMMNQFDNCCCFGLDPKKPDKASIQALEKHTEIVWVLFRDDFEVADLSAETMAHMFSNFGDFHAYKDTK